MDVMRFSHANGLISNAIVSHYPEDQEFAIEVTQGKQTGVVILDNSKAQKLYEALGEALYGSLDDYDAEAIANQREQKENLLNQFKDLIHYTA